MPGGYEIRFLNYSRSFSIFMIIIMATTKTQHQAIGNYEERGGGKGRGGRGGEEERESKKHTRM